MTTYNNFVGVYAFSTDIFFEENMTGKQEWSRYYSLQRRGRASILPQKYQSEKEIAKALGENDETSDVNSERECTDV